MATGSSVIHKACCVPGVESENCGSGVRNWPGGSPSGGSHVIVQVSSTARLWGHAGFFHAQWTHILHHLPGSRRNLTELLRRADQGVPIASVDWTVAEYLPYWLSEVVREDR